MILLFKNPVFKSDINVTVRRGIKWSEAVASGELKFPIMDTYDPDKKIIGYAKDIKVVVKRFFELAELDVKDEHDEDCRTVQGLYMEMKKVYGNDFDNTELVTIMQFTFEPIV